jgi:hypothetical protein
LKLDPALEFAMANDASTVTFITFREERGWAGSQPVVGFAEKPIIEELLGKKKLSDVFEGYLEYESVDGNQRFIGVWGNRNTVKLRQMLREKGARIVIERPSPTLFRQRHRASR